MGADEEQPLLPEVKEAAEPCEPKDEESVKQEDLDGTTEYKKKRIRVRVTGRYLNICQICKIF